MGYGIGALIGYLLGCSNMAYFLGKWHGADLRRGGTGNLGASNTVVLLGWKAGVLTALHDIGKAVLAVLVAKWLFPAVENVGAVAGVACVLGHIFPFYLNFKGGKGFASYFGVTLALNWKLALVLMVVGILVTLITDYITCATVTTVVTVPVYLFFTSGWLLAAILLVATVVMLWKHRENYRRILSGTELGLRSAMKGENRISKG